MFQSSSTSFYPTEKKTRKIETEKVILWPPEKCEKTGIWIIQMYFPLINRGFVCADHGVKWHIQWQIKVIYKHDSTPS